MRITYNVSAMLTNNALKNNNDLLSQSLERLSSGLKLNHAKDNPAGLAMAKRMGAQLHGISVATGNSGNGVSVIEIADGALQEVTEMLQRINELTVKASHGILMDEDREMIQDEITQLQQEITRVAKDTEFNSQPLLDGTFEYKGYTNTPRIKVDSYSENVTVGEYSFMINNMSRPDGIITHVNMTLGAKFPTDTSIEYLGDDRIKLYASNNFEIVLSFDETYTPGGTHFLDITGIGPMRLQVGANEGQIIEVRIPEVSLKNMGIANIDVGTEESATDALSRMGNALKFLSGVRSRLGAYQNRLESTINNLDVTFENMTAAYSRIMDTDMAEEMTLYTTNQVMTQAGMSMLAQANERPAQVLQLLQ